MISAALRALRLGSTRARLALIQVAVLAIAAGIADVSVYRLVLDPARSSLDGSLYDQLHGIAGGLVVEGGTARIAAPLPAENGDGVAIEALVFDKGGSRIAASPAQSLPEGFTAALARRALDSQEPQTVDARDRSGGQRRVYTESAQLGEAPNQVQVAVVVSRSSAELTGTERRLLLTLAAGSLLLLLVGGGLALWLTGRALRPVGEIAAVARSLGEHDLHRRVEVSAPDDELGELVSTFNLMLARLEAAFESLHRFTGDASHELRAPLALVRTQIEVALNRPRTGAEYERVLRSVLEQEKHLSRISEQLLLIARADAGELRPEVVRIDVADFIHELASRWTAVAERRGIELKVEAPASGELDADPALTRRVIDNLIDNALRYSPELSTVLLSVRREGADWLFEVSDEGMGIPAPDRARIFERFARADQARTRGSAGAGLGLALSSAIARAQGGSLAVADRPPPGSTFELRLPAG